jgi:NAD(P)-dependent dehydrogenase (short-subunit alcohol dehydrogenase family)
LIGLTKSLAAELGQRSIRVNAICPGSVEGKRIDRIIAAEASLRGVDQNTVKGEFVDTNSMKVFIDKEDVAALVLFLCSEQGRYISGQAIGVDGNTEVKW